MKLKPDFAAAQARWDFFWNDGPADRPVCNLRLRKAGAETPPFIDAYDLPRLTDRQAAARQVLAHFAGYHWLGEAIPGYTISFCPDHLALLLGAGMTCDDGSQSGTKTGWVHPFLDDYGQEIRFRPEGEWWELTVAVIRDFRRAAEGEMIISGPNLQGNLDALAAIRGPMRLLTDLMDCPEDVHVALERIDAAQEEVRRALDAELEVGRFGSRTRHGTYSRGAAEIPQCDFSAMIGPDMFREFALPHLRRECEGLGAAHYHLDGPDAIKHLPALAEIEKLHFIQWQPGDGQAAARDWSGLYDQIDGLGLGIMCGGTREKVKSLWRTRRNRHRMYVDGVKDIATPDEAKAFLESPWPVDN